MAGNHQEQRGNPGKTKDYQWIQRRLQSERIEGATVLGTPNQRAERFSLAEWMAKKKSKLYIYH